MESVIAALPKPMEPEYPYLGLYKKDGDFVVLFNKPLTGVVVWSVTDIRPIGESHSSWEEKEFEFYDGAITLSN